MTSMPVAALDSVYADTECIEPSAELAMLKPKVSFVSVRCFAPAKGNGCRKVVGYAA